MISLYPTELAADPDIDMVVSCVRVDKHYPTAIPALRAGKVVYVEWPLGSNLEQAQEMATIAKDNKAITLVGLQGQYAPVVRKVKELVSGGSIGKVLSSLFVIAVTNGGATESWSVDYFTDRAVGGNPTTIALGHSLEAIEYGESFPLLDNVVDADTAFISVLGDLTTVDGLMLNGHPQVDIIRKDGSIVEKGRKKDVPDQIVFHSRTSEGAVFSLYQRGGKAMPNTPVLDWRIHGKAGEIRITSPSAFLALGSSETKIELYDHRTGEVKVVEPEKDDLEHLPVPARNIARLYEQFAKDKKSNQDFDHAMAKHRIIADLYRQYDSQA